MPTYKHVKRARTRRASANTLALPPSWSQLANTLDPGTVNTKMLLAGWGRIGIQVRDADNTWALCADPGPQGGSGGYLISGRGSRPVAEAADRGVQDRMWALWEEQCGCKFRL